ncbi:uncharacterized protein LOC108680780 [Hyalella azteca]|uniref:Uncharacterized protein LOC108680780 n=1 Tax=Hyalella azteca TaxID=294128 RepID=A0A8B7PI18_HYAAZ|nr:uncharacterized protein LOC108680780 [Hyalella azteca]
MYLSSIVFEMLRRSRVTMMMLLSVLHGTGAASTGSSRYRVHPQAGFGITDTAAVVHYTSSAIQCAQRCSISGSSVFSVTEENTGKVRCRIASSGFRAENLTAGAAAAGETTYVDELSPATIQEVTTTPVQALTSTAPTQGPCLTASDIVCATAAPATFFYHPSDCSKYLWCTGGTNPIQMACAPCTYWQLDITACVTTRPAKCSCQTSIQRAPYTCE